MTDRNRWTKGDRVYIELHAANTAEPFLKTGYVARDAGIDEDYVLVVFDDDPRFNWPLPRWFPKRAGTRADG